jgi:hypothetical protein
MRVFALFAFLTQALFEIRAENHFGIDWLFRLLRIINNLPIWEWPWKVCLIKLSLQPISPSSFSPRSRLPAVSVHFPIIKFPYCLFHLTLHLFYFSKSKYINSCTTFDLFLFLRPKVLSSTILSSFFYTVFVDAPLGGIINILK